MTEELRNLTFPCKLCKLCELCGIYRKDRGRTRKLPQIN